MYTALHASLFCFWGNFMSPLIDWPLLKSGVSRSFTITGKKTADDYRQATVSILYANIKKRFYKANHSQ